MSHFLLSACIDSSLVMIKRELERSNSAKASFGPAATQLPLSLGFRVTTAYPCISCCAVYRKKREKAPSANEFAS